MSHISVLRLHPEAKIPKRATSGSTGMDIHSVEETVLAPGKWAAIRTGLVLGMEHLDPNVEIQIRPRSGLALNHGVTVLNSPGTIDRDYTGEIKVILINHSEVPYKINVGDRIAQMVMSTHSRQILIPITELSYTSNRADGGFGSTGSA